MRIRLLCLILLLTATALAAPTFKLLVGGKEVKFFRPTDHTLNFQANLPGTKLGQTKIEWHFIAVETSSGDKGLIKKAETSGLIANEVTGTLTLPKDWPYGNYKAELYLNGKLEGTVPYVISPEIKDLKVTGHALFQDDGKGGLGQKVPHFSPTDRTLHFAVGVNGFIMGKAEMVWSFTAVDTPLGKNQSITSLKKDISDFPGDTLTAHIEFPRDWPKGTYRADVTLNGKPLDTINYEVK